MQYHIMLYAYNCRGISNSESGMNNCQYKDIPVWSVTIGRPKDRVTKDRVTLLAKIQKSSIVS